MKTDIKVVGAEIGALLGIFIGGVNGLIIALIIFAVVDYITGVSSAVINHNLNSEIGFKGITKKVLLFLIVGVANVMDVYVIGDKSVCRSAVCLFYIANEGLSILENSAKCGIPIPRKLEILLEQLREEDDHDPT